MKIEASFVKDRKEKYVLIHIDEEMAISLMESISNQLLKRNPNIGRTEYRTEKGEYFSVFVNEFRPTIEDVHREAKQMFQNWVEAQFKPFSKRGGKK